MNCDNEKDEIKLTLAHENISVLINPKNILNIKKYEKYYNLYLRSEFPTIFTVKEDYEELKNILCIKESADEELVIKNLTEALEHIRSNVLSNGIKK